MRRVSQLETPWLTLGERTQTRLDNEGCCEADDTGGAARAQDGTGQAEASRTLYILASFSFRSFLETPARPGWITSTTYRRGQQGT